MRIIHGVDEFVLGQALEVFEWLVARFAVEEFDVGFRVFLQLGFDGERLAAYFALVRPLSGVGELVVFEAVLRGVDVAAYVTFVALFTGVD